MNYKLIDIFDHGGIWDRQIHDLKTDLSIKSTFWGWGRLLGSGTFLDAKCNAPWGWDDEDDGPILRGEMALDPIHLVNYWFGGLDSSNDRYTRSRYLNDLMQGGYHDTNLPECWPKGLSLEKLYMQIDGKHL